MNRKKVFEAISIRSYSAARKNASKSLNMNMLRKKIAFGAKRDITQGGKSS
jgi:hypothetical protein